MAFIPDLTPLLGIANNIIGQGAVMGKLSDFPFYMHKNEYEQIARTLSATFSEYQPIKGQALTGDSGGYSQNIQLNGVLVAEPIDSLVGLENMLKLREPVRFTTLEYDFECVITSLNITKKNFYKNGEARVSLYNITLKETYGDIV